MSKEPRTTRKAKKTIKRIAAICLGVATYKGIQAKRLMKQQQWIQDREELEQVNRSVSGRETPDVGDRIRMCQLRMKKADITKKVQKMQKGRELGQHIGAAIGGMGRAVSHAGLQRGMTEAMSGNVGGRYMADVPTAMSGMVEPEIEAGG